MVGGARLTGRAGRFSIGALNIQTEDKPSARAVATNFTAIRLKRNIFRRSNVGVIATRRGPGGDRAGDASYTRRRRRDAAVLQEHQPHQLLRADQRAGRRAATRASYRGRFDYTDDRYGAAAEHMLIGSDFRPEVGYVRRTDFRRSFGQARFSPRPKTQHAGAQADVAGQPRLRHRRAGDRWCRTARRAGLFGIEFQTSDRLKFEHTRDYELLPAPFTIAPGVVVPAGGYDYRHQPRAATPSASSARCRAGSSASAGTLYDGTKSEVTYSGRWGVVPRFSVEPA